MFVFGELAMALFIDTWGNLMSVRRGFAIGRIAALVSVVFLYLLYSVFLLRVREFALRHMYSTLPSLALVIASMFVPQRWLVLVLWLATYFVEQVTGFFVFSRKIVNGHTIAVSSSPVPAWRGGCTPVGSWRPMVGRGAHVWWCCGVVCPCALPPAPPPPVPSSWSDPP
jgi:hypothetical protein